MGKGEANLRAGSDPQLLDRDREGAVGAAVIAVSGTPQAGEPILEQYNNTVSK